MDKEKAIQILKRCEAESHCEHYKRHYCCIGCGQREALDLAIEALGQTEIVRCKDCKHYNPPHIEYNDGTRKDYPDGLVTVDIGMNVGGKCENSTTTMRTYCIAHDRENPDDFEELVIFRQPMEYCSFGEKAEKHQLSGETSTISEKESVEGIAESATTTDCISRRDALKPFYITSDGTRIPEVDCDNFPVEFSVKDIKRHLLSLPPVTPTERTGEWIPCTKEGLALTELMRREGKKWDGYRCTNCNFIYKGNALTESRYCQGCGAKMKGGIENDRDK